MKKVAPRVGNPLKIGGFALYDQNTKCYKRKSTTIISELSHYFGAAEKSIVALFGAAFLPCVRTSNMEWRSPNRPASSPSLPTAPVISTGARSRLASSCRICNPAGRGFLVAARDDPTNGRFV
ncbi:MAG: hypothetical protein LBG47_03775 [Prevotellaceae bacterium]|jgi:hypothetical protein|nr:hypothetical protein [Prevotellaceae bacterium]